MLSLGKFLKKLGCLGPILRVIVPLGLKLSRRLPKPHIKLVGVVLLKRVWHLVFEVYLLRGIEVTFFLEGLVNHHIVDSVKISLHFGDVGPLRNTYQHYGAFVHVQHRQLLIVVELDVSDLIVLKFVDSLEDLLSIGDLLLQIEAFKDDCVASIDHACVKNRHLY